MAVFAAILGAALVSTLKKNKKIDSNFKYLFIYFYI
jgi:hypothetical protein